MLYFEASVEELHGADSNEDGRLCKEDLNVLLDVLSKKRLDQDLKDCLIDEVGVGGGWGGGGGAQQQSSRYSVDLAVFLH